MPNRRLETRAPVDFFVNKYIDGYPYLCHAENMSWQGLLMSRTIEPAVDRPLLALEMGLPGVDRPIWVWAKPVWTAERQQAFRFMGLDEHDGDLLARYLDSLAA